jgi:hypothetical protein
MVFLHSHGVIGGPYLVDPLIRIKPTEWKR